MILGGGGYSGGGGGGIKKINYINCYLIFLCEFF